MSHEHAPTHVPSPQKTIVITGASDGIGAAAARILHRQRPEDNLILVGRDPKKTKAVASKLGVRYHVADFTSLGEVHRLARELDDLETIDVLANNAGGIFDGPLATVDGFERTWQINVVAPFLLTSLLQDKIRAVDGLVVQTASVANFLMSKFDPADPNTFDKFSSERAYGNAKVGSILLTRFIHSHGINSVAFHPGVLATNFSSELTGKLNKLYFTPGIKHLLSKPKVGGANLAYFITGTPGIHFESGEYYNDKRKPGLQRPIAKNVSVAKRIFADLAQSLNVEW
ncbi:oxidoreductase [Corynebacterium phocae]|uniref:Oxidoreductase n=2 Tax=Corynebacterium phocae TaxID=161895 RepID=A0A1L7D4A0_9CORY|nr:SDR family NAD(P)-dependent oxidoreductase [Corynebacterium phocae]APT92940.1 oxidoreductase [Corynebacterium phocae]KAA8723273.1 SDR family NAD(P)-dependent oxidoreductase [Corynebacterium phocae]